MAGDVDVAVRIEDFAAFRRDIRAIDRDVDKELRAGLKQATERTVLPLARALTPHRTGKLAASLRVRAAGNRVAITSRLPYANVIHWGGTTGRGHQFGHGAIYVRRSLFAERAIESRQGAIVDAVGDELMAFTRRHGFH